MSGWVGGWVSGWIPFDLDGLFHTLLRVHPTVRLALLWGGSQQCIPASDTAPGNKANGSWRPVKLAWRCQSGHQGEGRPDNLPDPASSPEKGPPSPPLQALALALHWSTPWIHWFMETQ